VHLRPCDLAALERVIEAVYQPVWIVGTGGILHSNASAREADELSQAVMQTGVDDDPRFVVSRVAIGRTSSVSLVVAHPITPAPLPPSLARIAALVARGLSDKDIARSLEIPLTTVRTYVRRIYTRLGVRSRVELARRWSRR
jgi:DNA-binding NarL/FixJ family response regulator